MKPRPPPSPTTKPVVKPRLRPPQRPPLVNAAMRPVRGVLALLPQSQPLEFQILGRTLLHAALVGIAAGVFGCLLFAALELVQHVVLERLIGYQPLHAVGEGSVIHGGVGATFRPWLLWLVPAAGALLGGLVSRFVPEARGGGGDATIEAFHAHGGAVPARVIWAKPLASVATLGTGGAGGREGPTMLIGAALGATVGRLLATTARERRVLMVAGVAAGIAAVFRTPLGAALLAIEVLYKDDFESEALVPSVLASVIAYSIAISVFGETTMFGRLPHYTFEPRQLPLYLALAVVIALGGSLFVGSMRLVQRVAPKLPGPVWTRPALGGLAMGIFATALILIVGPMVGRADRGMGVLGGGYGAAQIAITGADWFPATWTGVEILVLLAFAKMIASSFTIGTGGSAGDFAPSLAIGGLLGGAFGLAARLALDDPSIEPGAFALVGMGAFYGGIANVPLAALVLVSEMAGSYDLLVPLMLAEGVAFVALRRVALYPAQPRTTKDSPVHRATELDVLGALRCGELVRRDRAFVTLAPTTTGAELTHIVEAAAEQDVFPVVDATGSLCGLVSAESLRVIASNPDVRAVAIAADVMVAPVQVVLQTTLRAAAELMLERDLRAVPVLDDGAIVGLLDEHDLARAFLAAGAQPAGSRG